MYRRAFSVFFACWTVVVLLLATPLAAQVRIQGDITVHPPPQSAPAAQRLAYAQRLHEADRLSEAAREAADLAKGHDAVVAPEALLLLARVRYSQGWFARSLEHFDDLLLRFPLSAPVSDGRLLDRLEQGTAWLLADDRWEDGGAWLALLESVDGAAVNHLLKDMQQRLHQEIRDFEERQSVLVKDTPSAFNEWLAAEARRRQTCGMIVRCDIERRGCVEQVEQRMREAETERPRIENAQWQRAFTAWHASERDALTNEAHDALQAFPMLKRLISREDLAGWIEPRRPPRVDAPFLYRVERYEFERHDNAWRWGATPYLAARSCTTIDRVAAQRVATALEPLQLRSLPRRDLLERLKVELGRVDSQGDDRRRL
ncbi:hypothetical protein CKO15_05650 [Halorhodospira abdelmalekii]|nr:hypothetical protein [Halorhodospira abdelmalekii]